MEVSTNPEKLNYLLNKTDDIGTKVMIIGVMLQLILGELREETENYLNFKNIKRRYRKW